LNDVTYDFDFGKKYLLMGKSGIGKSTLLNAIIGYTEIKNGSIDVTDGVDKASNVNETSHLIGYVHQKPFLFIGNLVENITMFSKNPDMDKVTLLIKRCKLDDFASQRGLYAPLDNSSNAISIGEMQRISLARTLYLDRPILFLDEITSSLDEKNAKEINDVIRNNENKLIIWISHSRDMKELSWIDKKIKIENAKIAEI